MDKGYFYKFIRDHPIAHMATIHNGRPHLRAMLAYRADEEGVIFHTAKSKELYKQLVASPQVELCFNDYGANVQVRVSGDVEFDESLELKKEIEAARERLQPWIHHVGYDMLAIIRLKNGLAHVWMPEITFMPKRYVRL